MKNLNRIEEKRLKKDNFKEKRKRVAIVLICLIFFICMIYVTDTATSKMLQKSDNKYAIYVKVEKDGIMRLDLAGKTVELYISPIIETLRNIYLKISKSISALH